MLQLELDIGVAQAVGHLELLFNTTAKHTPHGDIGKMPDAIIAKRCGWTGDPLIFIQALVKCRWLDECTVNRLTVHDWEEHCDESTRKQVIRSKIPFKSACLPLSGQRQTTADNGGQNLPTMPNQALPSQTMPLPCPTTSFENSGVDKPPAKVPDYELSLSDFPERSRQPAIQAAQYYCTRRYKGTKFHESWYSGLLREAASLFEVVDDPAVACETFRLKCIEQPTPALDRNATFSDIALACGLKRAKPPPWEQAKAAQQDDGMKTLNATIDKLFGMPQ